MTLNSSFAASLTNCHADAMLVFDASGSMAEIEHHQFSISRIKEARAAIKHALPEITPFRRVGLILYGPGPGGPCDSIDLRLLPSRNSASQIIAEIEATNPNGGTPLTEAVQGAARVLSTSDGSGVVVLVTDGAETCGGRPCHLAAVLAQTNITVHVIGFRLPFDTLVFSDHTGIVDQRDFDVDQRERLDTKTRCLAEQTGGKFVTADSTDELIAALQDVLACPVIGRLPIDKLHQPPS